MSKDPISWDAKCRVEGCARSVPSYGGYPGLPQARCPHCGMKNRNHSSYDKVPDFDEPTYPHASWELRHYEGVERRQEARAQRKAKREAKRKVRQARRDARTYARSLGGVLFT